MTNSLYLKPFRLIRATFLIKCETLDAAGLCPATRGYARARTGSHHETRRNLRVSLKNMTDAALTPTPNDCDLPRIRAQFATFNDAIDYAAQSLKGLNFHDMRGELARVYPYSEMSRMRW